MLLSIALLCPPNSTCIDFSPLHRSQASEGSEIADDHRIIKHADPLSVIFIVLSILGPVSNGRPAPISLNPLSSHMFCAVCATMVTNKNRLLPPLRQPARSLRAQTHARTQSGSKLNDSDRQKMGSGDARAAAAYFRSFQAAAVPIHDQIGAIPSLDFKRSIRCLSGEEEPLSRYSFAGQKFGMRSGC